MTTVTFPDNCGNSPKSLKTVAFYVALFAANIDEVLKQISDDFEYIIYGDISYKGKEGMRKLLLQIETLDLQKVTIEQVISHGKYAACKGTAQTKDGNSMVFAEMLTFATHSSSAVIKTIESYTIML